jgi:DNA-binding IclR family transcriptional regulator
MQNLLSSVRETVHINIIESKIRVCIDTIESPERLKATMPIGSSAPLYSGASSKCLLAFSSQEFIENYLQEVILTRITNHTITDITQLRLELTKIRKQGYAASLAELSPGLGALSAPLLNFQNVLLASLSLAIPEQRYRDTHHRRFCIEQLCNTAQEFSKIMGKEGKSNV